MRYLLFMLVFTLSFLTYGQNVLSKFEKNILTEDFSGKTYLFPQKYNANELFMVEHNLYRLRRISPEAYSIAYIQPSKIFAACRILTDVELLDNNNRNASCGLILHSQKNGSGALFVEINNRKRIRVKKLWNEQEKWLIGAGNDGWIKSKHLNKKGVNQLEIRTKDGYYDIFINKAYALSLYDTSFHSGQAGLFINASSEMFVHHFEIYTDQASEGAANTKLSTNTEESFQDVILIFKAKIDQQEKELSALQMELNKCRSMLNYDTTLIARSAQLESNNERLKQDLDSLTNAHKIAVKRLDYLESIKEDIEASSNGDLILNLTTLLSDIKTENTALKSENASLKSDRKKLTADMDILIKEIDRLRQSEEVINSEK